MTSNSLIVGGTAGIGYAIASRLAADNPSSTVIISGRHEPKKIPHSNMMFRELDASSMRAIKNYTEEIKASKHRFGILVLTQGVLTTDPRIETSEGIDRKMALNYYGRQLLIRELMSVLTNDAKVLLVLDSVHGGPNKLVWNDLDLRSNFSTLKAAAHCMSMMDAMIQYYGTEEENIGTKRQFIHATPGIVRTKVASSLPWYLRGPISFLIVVLGVSPETCAKRMLKGVEKASAAGDKEGRRWGFINEKGVVFKKPAWTEKQVLKVREHTWEIIDNAFKAC
ncbi:hypothetical protein ACLX1H_004760 [Fusarium chlamydosporum]